MLMIEIAGYIGAAALIGLILGYLVWGWGQRQRVENARAEGAAAVRTSVDGDGLRERVETLERENARLERRIADLSGGAGPDAHAGGDPDEEDGAEDAARPEPAAPISIFAPRPAPQAIPVEPPPDMLGTIRARFAEKSRENDDDEIADIDGLDSVEGTEPDFDYAATDPLPAEHDAAMPDLAPQADLDADLRADLHAGLDAEPEPAHDLTPGPVPTPPDGLHIQRPDEIDDLKRIQGIGGRMEGILNDRGIYQFRQIAAFSDGDIDWVSEAIDAFPGRIKRDDWVGQARALHMEKYGRAFDEEQV